MVARIGIDICNTIADVNECIRQALNLPDACFKEYGLSRYGIDGEWFAKHLEVFAEAEPIPGAAQALDILASGGAEIYYLTARPEKARVITAEWLKRWGFPDGRLIMTQEKDKAARELSLDLVVEDAPPEIAKLKKVRVNIVVYRQPYNDGLFDWKHCVELPYKKLKSHRKDGSEWGRGVLLLPQSPARQRFYHRKQRASCPGEHLPELRC